MAVVLTQAEADALLALEKHRIDESEYGYPFQGRLIVRLQSADGREPFLLDIHRGRINLSKGGYQTRARQMHVLARLDFGGAPHRNPDDEEIGCPHLHVYREGHGLQWAVPLPADRFLDKEDAWAMLYDFMRFCAITRQPFFKKGLFT
jgi:hypothetical protein